MITFGAIVTTAWVVLFLFIVFCIAGIHCRARGDRRALPAAVRF